MTVPGFEHLAAKRNTIMRADLIGLPEDMTGEKVIELGSNCGSMAFLCAQRGASVIGYEFNQQRVDVANDIAKFAGLTAYFHQMDFDEVLPDLTDAHRVVALAFDVYLKQTSRMGLYEHLGQAPIVHFESNAKWGPDVCILELATLSGMTVTCLGSDLAGRIRLLLEQK